MGKLKDKIKQQAEEIAKLKAAAGGGAPAPGGAARPTKRLTAKAANRLLEKFEKRVLKEVKKATASVKTPTTAARPEWLPPALAKAAEEAAKSGTTPTSTGRTYTRKQRLVDQRKRFLDGERAQIEKAGGTAFSEHSSNGLSIGALPIAQYMARALNSQGNYGISVCEALDENGLVDLAQQVYQDQKSGAEGFFREHFNPDELSRTTGGDSRFNKALIESQYASGGSFVPEVVAQEYIDFLRAEEKFDTIGFRSIVSPRVSLSVPKLTSGTTATFVGEQVPPAPSTPGTGQVSFNMKTLAVKTVMSLDFINDNIVQAEGLIRDAMAKDWKLKRELTAMRGLTGQAYSPAGMRYLMDSANVLTQTGTTLSNIITDMYRLIGSLQDAFVELNGACYIMAGRPKRTLEQQRDSVGNFMFPTMRGANPSFQGYPVYQMMQLPVNLGGGANQTELYFVQPKEYWIGTNTAMVMSVSTEAAYDDNGTVRTAFDRREMVIMMWGKYDHQFAHAKGAAVMSDSTL